MYDATDYAKGLGYKGERAVRVLDGKVVSHGNICWAQFCDRLRRLKPRKLQGVR